LPGTPAGLARLPAGVPGKTGLILRSRLTTLEKLLLVALYQEFRHDPAAQRDVASMTAKRAAELCSCHRVTAQNALARLRQLGVLRPHHGGDAFVWDILAALAGPAESGVQGQAVGLPPGR
jgi:hypothetical protein